MNNTSKLALNLQESDYSTFSLGIFSACLLSLFCLCCLKIRPKKTSKKNSRYTHFPRFVTSFLCWVLRFKNIFSIIFQKLNIDCCEINSDSYLSLPCEKDVIGWHRDNAFQLESKNIKFKSERLNIKFFIYLNPNPFAFKQKISLILKRYKKPSKGALALIPCSSRFTRAVDNAIFKKFIPLDRDHSLGDVISRLEDILNEMDKRNLQSLFDLKRIEYIKFIETAKNVLSSKPGLSNFFTTFSVNPGKVVVFNDRVIHRGGATMDTERLVLRFIATGIRLEDI